MKNDSLAISIASGKGGTGKTTLAVNLAAVAGEVTLLDCDVEEPNDHLFVRPTWTRREPVEVLKPLWNAEACTGCGECARACNYNALAVVKKKVMNAFTGGQPTIREQREKGGNPSICSVYQYFFYFFEEKDRKIKELEENCRSGNILCGECKENLAKKVIKFLERHQRKREKARNLLDRYIVRD